jgi:outer membrane protein assembly factor BamB
MKKSKLPILLVITLLAGSMLSACAGGAGLANSWSGLLVDSQSQMIYMASNNHVYAINPTNGTEKWRFPAKADNKITFYAPPLLTEDGQLIEGGYDHKLYSINPENGQQNWTYDKANDKYIGSALASAGMILAPNVNYFLYALGSNGSPNWEFSAEQALWAKPLTDDERIYLASMDHHIYALNPETGEQIWKSEDVGGAVVSSFALDADGILFVGTLGSNFSAVEVASGDVIWTTPTKGWVWSKPVLMEDLIYVSDQDGNVYALEAQSGAVRWQIQPDTGEDRAIISTPIIVEDTLYFASQAGILYAVDAASGTARWNKVIGGKIYTDLALLGDTIFVAPLEFDSALVAVDLQGNVRWNFTPAK